MQSFIISENDANQRVDVFLKKFFVHAPLSAIYSMIRKNKIKIDNKKKDIAYMLQVGEEIKIYLSDEDISSLRREDIPTKTIAHTVVHTRALDPSHILYEDAYILVLDKQPGMNVHPGDHKTTEISCIELVQDYLGSTYHSLTFRPALVHRIDRDTSGILLFAKTKTALEKMLYMLQNDGIEKVYRTIVVGVPTAESGTISARLLRTENAKNEAKVRVDTTGQSAVTHWKKVHTENSI
jgi:23S rRNA-/tRNA-specific pseudouridylate synthase